MKTIEPIQIWNNGQVKTASVFNAKANVNLNNDANFDYFLYTINDDGTLGNYVALGNIYMPTDEYLQWDQDEFAWDFVANSLNLVITGDYTPPQNIEQSVEINPESL